MKIIFLYEKLYFHNVWVDGAFLMDSERIIVVRYKSLLLRYSTLIHELLHYVANLISKKHLYLHRLIDKYLWMSEKTRNKLRLKGIVIKNPKQ